MTRCAICGRKLKNKDSVAKGIGPECASGNSKPIKNWNRRVINSAKIKNGAEFIVGINSNTKIVNNENFENMKSWLIKYKYILKDGEVSDEILNKIFRDPNTFFGGNINGEKNKE
jgi:alpha-glucuronidase